MTGQTTAPYSWADCDEADHATATMYSKPGCYQCKASARKFAKLGISLTVIDVTADLVGLVVETLTGQPITAQAA